MDRKGYSRKGFFGQTIHYDADGNKIGESVRNFWGGFDHYDAKGNKVGGSQKNVWAGLITTIITTIKPAPAYADFGVRKSTIMMTAKKSVKASVTFGAVVITTALTKRNEFFRSSRSNKYNAAVKYQEHSLL